jgi:hypothetical protein
MGHGLQKVENSSESVSPAHKQSRQGSDDFVLEKSIFNNVFEKDIRRVFIYKKAERLAKAIYLIAPAFKSSPALHAKLDALALAIVEGALDHRPESRDVLSRQLLTLSSVLQLARTGGLLSAMNAEIITREAQFLLQEVAAHEEPRLTLDDVPSLAHMSRTLPRSTPETQAPSAHTKPTLKPHDEADDKGHIKDRQQAVLSIISSKGEVSIKDISHLIRGVSEKTIQRELLALIGAGKVQKRGERRWSVYSLR